MSTPRALAVIRVSNCTTSGDLAGFGVNIRIAVKYHFYVFSWRAG
jgi:hypothetical protein